jgi:hypothetical protein
MANGKKSFILYVDLISVVEKLITQDRANKTNYSGELFYHILRYVNDEKPIAVDFIVDMAFEPIRLSLKRDLDKYAKYIDKQKVNGSKGGRPKKPNANPKEPKETQPFFKEPKKADSVSVSVSVNDTVNVNDNVIVIKKEVIPKIQKEFSADVLNCYDKCLLFFPEEIRPKLATGVLNWKNTIDKLNRLDKIPFEKIIEITKKTRADSFWAKNFLSLTKLRLKQKTSDLYYIQVFNEQIKSNGNDTRTTQEVARDAFNSDTAKKFRFS